MDAGPVGARGRVASLLDRHGRVVVALGLFTALLWARTAGITENFWLLGEQIRDWSIALGPWNELPLAGTPSTVGGRSLGPIYYWVLWAIRVTIGPLFDNLPHAGAIGLSAIQAAADVTLFFVLWRHAASATLALAVVLLAATAPYDMALTATIWNPPLAVAFVKFALALFLISATHPSRWRMAGTIVVAWLAVQAHSSAIFVFAPMASWFVIRELAERQGGRAAQNLRLMLELLLILQIPFLIDRLTSPASGPANVAAEAIARVIAHPATATPEKAYVAIRDALSFFWAYPKTFTLMGGVLPAAALVCVLAVRRRPWMLFVTIGPLIASIAAFSGWTRPFDYYWFLTMSPAIALMVGEALTIAPQWRVREALALAFLTIVLWLHPQRLIGVTQLHKLPEYGPLLQGTREIARRTPEIRNIFTEFELPPSTESTFLFTCLGGRVVPEGAYDAFIARDGSVSFRTAQE